MFKKVMFKKGGKHNFDTTSNALVNHHVASIQVMSCDKLSHREGQ